jgi:hypothetical protein
MYRQNRLFDNQKGDAKMKKSILVVTMILLLSLLVTSTASAGLGTKLPKWEVAFDPAPQLGEWADTYYGVEFKGNLYFVFWYLETVDQVWGTSNGKDWSFAWDATSIQPDLEYIGPMTEFKGQLYLEIGDWEGELTDRIVRTSDGKNWETVAILPTSSVWVFHGIFTSFEGALYKAVVYDNNGVFECHLWRSISGDLGTWEDVGQFPWGIVAFADFKGALYVASDWYDPAQIYRSFDGKNWEPVTLDGFGDPTNVISDNFGERGGYLYVSLASFENPGDIWRTQDGISWEAVTTDGFGNEANAAFTFVAYQKYLYAFSANDADGSIAYRSKDGINWEIANEPGWGDPGNWAVWRDGARVVFKGALYVSPEGPAGILRLGPPMKINN